LKQYYVYILTNYSLKTLYIGVTNNLERRLYEHRNELIDGFSKKYHCHNLLYFETTNSIESALEREKQLKRWSRSKKDELIKTMNPKMEDLSTSLEMTD
jgi:putative endonuclease